MIGVRVAVPLEAVGIHSRCRREPSAPPREPVLQCPARAARLAIIRATEIFIAPPLSAQSASPGETATGVQTHRSSCRAVDYAGRAAQPPVGPPASRSSQEGHSTGAGGASLDQVRAPPAIAVPPLKTNLATMIGNSRRPNA